MERAMHVFLEENQGCIAHDKPSRLSHSKYHKTSNVRRTQSESLTIPRLVLQLSMPNPLKPNIKSRKTM